MNIILYSLSRNGKICPVNQKYVFLIVRYTLRLYEFM